MTRSINNSQAATHSPTTFDLTASPLHPLLRWFVPDIWLSLNTVSRLQCCCGSTCFCTRQTRTRVVAVTFSPWTRRIVQDGLELLIRWAFLVRAHILCDSQPCMSGPAVQPAPKNAAYGGSCLRCAPTSCSFYPAGIIYSRSRVNRRDISRYTLCVLLDDSNSDTCCSSPVLLYNLGDPLHHCPHPLVGLPAQF